MGIFEDYDGMEKIGSVRSCREYYVHFAKEFDALYVHYGQAVYACEILNSNIDNISGLSSQEGFGQLYGYAGEETFYRTDDRPSPHNCYTSADRLIEATKNCVTAESMIRITMVIISLRATIRPSHLQIRQPILNRDMK